MNSRLGKWTNLRPKMAHPHNSGSAVRFFLEFCAVKRAIMLMKLIITIFTKTKFVGDKWAILDPEIAHPHNSGSALRIFLNFAR